MKTPHLTPTVIDILIPVHNRLEHTRQTIESLIKHTPREKYNLYITDDVSTNGTREYLFDLREKLHGLNVNGIIFFNKENIGPAASRNNMCRWITTKRLRSEYLYHSDNDVYFTDGWYEKLLNLYVAEAADNQVMLLGGGCHPYLQNKKEISTNLGVSTTLNYKIGIKDAVSGYSQLMSWEVWDRFGPFDEGSRGQDEKIMGSEDWALCQRIIKAGYSVGSVEPELVYPTGKTNTYGKPATGAETFKDVEGIMIK